MKILSENSSPVSPATGSRLDQTGVTSVLKILQCTNLGGMEQVAYGLLRELHVTGNFQFRLLTPRPFGDGEPLLRKIDPLAADFDYRGKFGWRSLPEFRQAIRAAAKTTDRIWITGTCSSSLSAVSGLEQPKLLSHHYHHFEDRASALKWFFFYHLLCHQLQAITYPTEFTRDEALRIAPWLKSKAHVVRHGYTVQYNGEEAREQRRLGARRQLGLPDDAFIVGNAGWLIKRKRFDVFLQTARHIRDKLPNAFFVICGGGPEEANLKEMAHRLGLSDAVRFTGWVRNLDPYYQAWDACLFNSDFDAFGRTPLEAACHGCVAVASVQYGGLKEFLVHNENGVFSQKHDPCWLAGEIVSLARHPSRATVFREAAAQKLRTDYDPAKSADCYRSLLS